MQQLHLVGITTELDGLIFSTRKGAKSGSFVVRLDDALIESIEQAARMRQSAPSDNGHEPLSVRVPRIRVTRPESRLTPREMQARLRAGHTIPQVAASAGVDEDWVERFAAPVLAEQSRILEMAHGLTTKSRRGMSALPLGDSVRANLYDRGIPLPAEYEGWTAFTLDGTNWVVRLDYVSRKRTQSAEWELDVEARQVAPRNRLASELGYLDPSRRRRPLPIVDEEAGEGEEADEPSPPRPRRRPVPRRSRPSARKTAARRSPARKAAGSTKAAPRKRPAAKRAGGSKKVTAKKAATKKLATKKPAAKKSTAGKKSAAAKKTAAKKTAAKKTAAKRGATAKKSATRKSASAKRAGTSRRATATKATTAGTSRRPRPLRAPGRSSAFAPGEPAAGPPG